MENKGIDDIVKSISIPNNLIQRIQGDYVAEKYQDGVFTFQSIDVDTVLLVLKSVMAWAEEREYLKGDILDTSFITRKK